MGGAEVVEGEGGTGLTLDSVGRLGDMAPADTCCCCGCDCGWLEEEREEEGGTDEEVVEVGGERWAVSTEGGPEPEIGVVAGEGG